MYNAMHKEAPRDDVDQLALEIDVWNIGSFPLVAVKMAGLQNVDGRRVLMKSARNYLTSKSKPR